MSVLLDAGPSLNFLAVGQQNVLIQLAGAMDLQLQAPERVDREVLGVARGSRFKRTAVQKTWKTLTSAGRVVILDDTLESTVFMNAVTRISGMPAKDRVRDSKSLGEIMVLAHASVYAQAGEQVFVLIDDGDGRDRALKERAWLKRNEYTGRVVLWSTRDVLEKAAEFPGWIDKEKTWEVVYDEMRKFDDGLVPR